MMSMPGNTSQTRADIIRQFLPTSPYVGHLGIQLTNMQPDVATLTLPFTNSLITIGTTMHGGAIASQVDTQGRQLTEELRVAAQKKDRGMCFYPSLYVTKPLATRVPEADWTSTSR